MQFGDQRESDQVEDRRGMGGGGGGFGFGGRSIGLGGIVVALVASYFLGVDPGVVINILSGGGGSAPQVQQQPARTGPSSDPQMQFVGKVLSSTEDVWTAKLADRGGYRKPKLTVFDNPVDTACGTGQSAMGPFYCPGDARVYLDLGFFNELQTRFKAPGDFARAYVIAHEVGHHVQNLLGITENVDRMRGKLSQTEQNAASVRVELQADCFAGIWAHDAGKASQIRLEPGDIEEALQAAPAIGDDKLQMQSRGRVVPDSFTHGSSAQRVSWFKRGFESGSLANCNTFEGRL
ncbi:neutral zinc metallopeptidase [soil metagenome]